MEVVYQNDEEKIHTGQTQIAVAFSFHKQGTQSANDIFRVFRNLLEHNIISKE